MGWGRKKPKVAPKQKKRGRPKVNATRVAVDGKVFNSLLESYCYSALKRARIPATYEKRTFELLPAFSCRDSYYCAVNGKFIERTNKVLNWSYTPDFEDDLQPELGYGFIIEVKGRANERYPQVLKMFRWYNEHYLHKDIFQPSTEEEVDKVIQLIKSKIAYATETFQLKIRDHRG